MGSITDYEKCNQCGGFYYIDYDYKTGNEYGICLSCGKSYHVSILRSENGEIIADEKGNAKCEREDEAGFGVCRISAVKGRGQFTAFSESPSTADINELLMNLQDENVDSKNSYLCVWDTDKQKLNFLFGSPLKYDNGDITTPTYDGDMEAIIETEDDLLPF